MSSQPVVCEEVQATESPEAAPALRDRNARECPVCFGEHDEAIHAASVRIRLWHREVVTRYLEEWTILEP